MPVDFQTFQLYAERFPDLAIGAYVAYTQGSEERGHGYDDHREFPDWWTDSKEQYEWYLTKGQHHAFNFAWMAGRGLPYLPFETVSREQRKVE